MGFIAAIHALGDPGVMRAMGTGRATMEWMAMEVAHASPTRGGKRPQRAACVHRDGKTATDSAV